MVSSISTSIAIKYILRLILAYFQNSRRRKEELFIRVFQTEIIVHLFQEFLPRLPECYLNPSSVFIMKLLILGFYAALLSEKDKTDL